MKTHYGLLVYAGDLDGTVDGHGPEATLIASGPAEFCWDALNRWTATHTLRPGEHAEVVARSAEALAVQDAHRQAWEARR